MDFSKGVFLSTCLIIALNLWGMQEQFYGFKSDEVDRYATGEPVQDGEYYAFVWTRNNVFDGFKKDGSLNNTNDNCVLYVVGLAKSGKCPPVNFVVPSDFTKEHPGGNFMVIALDTRTGSGLIPNKRDSGVPRRVNGWGYSKVYGSSYDPNIHNYGIVNETNAIIDNRTKLPDNTPQPKITGIKVTDRRIRVKCSNTMDYLSYYLYGGTNICDIEMELMVLDGLSDTIQELEFELDESALESSESEETEQQSNSPTQSHFFRIIGR